ncbi:hypothetical protein ACFLZ4_01900 [Patescibacteria group bacterium]
MQVPQPVINYCKTLIDIAAEYYDLNEARPMIKRHFKRSKNASISAIFRKVKKDARFSVYADYPIASLITEVMNEMGIKTTKKKLVYALKDSKDLQGKSLLMKQLLGM